MNAPIILFTYNRPWHTEQTLNALARNVLASESVLYVYCDGAKVGATAEQVSNIEKVRQVVRKDYGFKEVHIIEAKENKGLANSIIDGVTEVINKYGKVIVLEDDIVTSTGFLKYMNDALTLYKDEERVMHISAYMYPHKRHLPETFFYPVPYPGGGWATWQRAWQKYNNNTKELYDCFKTDWKRFNTFGGNYLQKQLEENLDGILKTWFIKWHAVLLQNNALTLYPSVSLTNNIGFDDSGSNCYTTDKFDVKILADSIIVNRVPIVVNRRAYKIIYEFYQGKWYSKRHRKKLLNFIKRLFSR